MKKNKCFMMLAMLLPCLTFSQTVANLDIDDMTSMSLEDLLNIKVVLLKMQKE